MAYRFWDSAVSTLVYNYGVCDSAGGVGTTCYELQTDFDEGDVGIPLWWTASDPYFATITAFLTNGTPNMTEPGVFERQTGNGAFSNQLESVYFGTQARNGVDLGGFVIQRIGVVFDMIRITPDYPNHATDWAIHGTAFFTQQATKDACQAGGWNVLRRMDGSFFKNQGDCIQYVNTGK